MTQENKCGDPLSSLWLEGYSIAELWGHSFPVQRGTSVVEGPHCLLWGILGIVEYQVDNGAGHKYLRDRLFTGDWIAVACLESESEDAQLCVVPPIKDAKFGRRKSAIGDGITNYVNARIVHSSLYTDCRPIQTE
jgi:hypothetical protein